MARSRKQQRAAKNEAAIHTKIEAPKIVEPVVVEPAPKIVEPPKPKPVKKRYVRPARVVASTAAPPLARGTTNAAKSMSAVLKGMVGSPATGTLAGSMPQTTAAGLTAGSLTFGSTSSRAQRRLAKRQKSED